MDRISGVFDNTMNNMEAWVDERGPALIAGVVILIIGWIASKLIQVGLTKSMKAIKLDSASETLGVESFLKRGNIQGGTVAVIGKVVYWVLLLLTILIAMNAMELTDEDLLKGVAGTVPGVVVGVVILFIGLSFARFIGELVQTSLANARVSQARFLGNLTRYAIVVIALTMALSHMGVDPGLVETTFIILIAAMALAMALAFGLGCRDLAGQIANDAWNKEKAAQRALDAASSEE